MTIGKFIINKFVPFLVWIAGAKKGSWEEKKYTVVLQSLIMTPVKRLKGIRRVSKSVEQQYDGISGLYIKDNYYEGRMRYSVVNGVIKNISSIENMQLIRKEMNEVLKTIEFNSVLEVGVGELTTLESVFDEFGPKIDVYGVDLSVNRIYHGLKEYRKRHKIDPTVAKGNAIRLPFPDNSFDLVYTRHTLEQMPTIYKEALDELIRVSKRHVILFEPSYELASLSQRIKMHNSDYVRGIIRFVKNRSDVCIKKFYLMKNSANPMNHTACYKLELSEPVLGDNSSVSFVCPYSRSPLVNKSGYFFSEESSRAYPIIEGIPVLDYDYSVGISEPDF
jgi:ubiquinone/menaquinone biosynthesis C-methylase UbiE